MRSPGGPHAGTPAIGRDRRQGAPGRCRSAGHAVRPAGHGRAAAAGPGGGRISPGLPWCYGARRRRASAQLSGAVRAYSL